MKKLTYLWRYFLIYAVVFYGLPMFAHDTGSYILLLLLITPSVCFLVSFIFGIKHGIDWLYLTIAAVLFIPAVFIYYNSSAWVYTIFYGGISVIGTLVGTQFFKRK